MTTGQPTGIIRRLPTLYGAASKTASAQRTARRRPRQRQARRAAQQRMSIVLWDMFTGSAPYREIFLRTLEPAFVGRYLSECARGRAAGRVAHGRIGHAVIFAHERRTCGILRGDTMETAISILRVVHIITAVLMAWPFYALVTVNNRAGLGVLATNPALGTKFVLLLLIGALLTHIFLVVQPTIDRLFVGASNPLTKEVAVQIQAWRLVRERVASVCLFSVLTAAMLGVQAWAAVPGWLTLGLLGGI